ncbi:PPK2 family polyphosphate:nucleotide phosphotransferase [Rhodopseudomonas rhenobacensis]|uniref:PPK2 family polyphosphate:nucleotide phosphotransferase n=1 Tax=Rhodopseudomonas rhenobacensis TaxID=87461 RepID=A0A7W7Z3A4_9BRAD|nr:polyphosphate kinase 2 family protein [Rhodopseudomonas rhenobacensis]MBB5047245.1 PPK2 family polyphosphate:nucleotide phosphotransferase [Rhodopseudomonas rhenobacensis]
MSDTKKSLAAKLKPYIAPFRVDGTERFHLKAHKTDAKGGLDKHEAEQIIEANRKRLNDFQEMLYAQDRWSLLLIFQGMDAAGKDTAIKSVFDGVNPQGCEVFSFKTPTSHELDHDFMWRAATSLPQRGRIGIFNRSYYEDVLVVRVHPEILAKQKIPQVLVTKKVWRERFEDIASFERYLARNGTVVLKFFLNVSKEEQRQRFLDRLEDPAKNWKFSMADVSERALWDRYQAAYQDAIAHTSTPAAPWHIVPADHKWFARVVIGSTIVAALEKLNLHFPKTDKDSLKEFKEVRLALEHEAKKGARPRRPAGKMANGKAGNGKAAANGKSPVAHD